MRNLNLPKSTIFNIVFIVAIIAIIIGLLYVIPLVLETIIAIIIYLLTAVLYTGLVFGIPFVCYRFWGFKIAMYVAMATTVIACLIVFYTQPNIVRESRSSSPEVVIDTGKPQKSHSNTDQVPEIKPQDVEPQVIELEPQVIESEPPISEPEPQIESEVEPFTTD